MRGLCIACDGAIMPTERAIQINEGVMQDGVPAFSPQDFLGFLHETCFYDLLNHINETLIPREAVAVAKATERSLKN